LQHDAFHEVLVYVFDVILSSIEVCKGRAAHRRAKQGLLFCWL